MNELIRELVKENLTPDAYMTYKGYLLHSEDPKVQEYSDPLPLYSEYDIAKIAQLVVRECMTICEDVTERNDPAIACYYAIKEHFGVEE